MKYRLLFAFLVTIVLVACEKNKFTTVPQVDAKSISPDEVHGRDIIRFVSEFTDKEGDIDSVLIAYKWYNGATAIVIDTFRQDFTDYNLPPKITDGEIFIEFEYGTTDTDFAKLSSVLKDTTAAFGLILIDKKNQRSNYAESKPIRLIKF